MARGADERDRTQAIIVGTIAHYLGKRADEYHSHRWTVYVRGLDGEDLSHCVESVEFALHPSFAPAELTGVVHAAEREALASGAELMYLGACRTYRKHGSWRVHVGRRPLGLSRCAVLCTHAYGVASAAAAGLFERISLALGSRLVPAMDQNLFRYAAQFSA